MNHTSELHYKKHSSIFHRLPEQLVRHLLSYLNVIDLTRCDMTCPILAQETEETASTILTKLWHHENNIGVDLSISKKQNLYLITERRLLIVDGSNDFIMKTAFHEKNVKCFMHFIQFPFSDDFTVLNISARELIAFGSRNGTLYEAHLYNMHSGVWKAVGPIPLNLRLVSCCLNNNTVYLSGGYCHGEHRYSDDVYVANISNTGGKCSDVSQWMLLNGGESKMLLPRCGHASIVFQDKLWVAGGRIAGVQGIVSSVETFDFRTKLWSTSADMTSKRTNFRMFEVYGNLYAVGGDRSANCLPLPLSIEKYDRQSEHWVRVGCLQDGRVDFTCSVMGSKIVVMRGKADGRGGLNDLVQIFDVLCENWDPNPRPFPCGDASTSTSRRIIAVPPCQWRW